LAEHLKQAAKLHYGLTKKEALKLALLYDNENVLVMPQSWEKGSAGSVWLTQRFPNFFHLRTPWQPISINCTFHISKILLINIAAVISNLYVVTVNKWPNNGLFPPLFNFVRVPLNVLVRTPGITRIPGWESLI
jgi:hypothetical protein